MSLPVAIFFEQLIACVVLAVGLFVVISLCKYAAQKYRENHQ